jgi:hypothetical protein
MDSINESQRLEPEVEEIRRHMEGAGLGQWTLSGAFRWALHLTYNLGRSAWLKNRADLVGQLRKYRLMHQFVMKKEADKDCDCALCKHTDELLENEDFD